MTSSPDKQDPLLYDDARDMLAYASIMYFLGDIRALARGSEDKDGDERFASTLELPLSAEQMNELFVKNGTFLKELQGERRHKAHGETFERLASQSKKQDDPENPSSGIEILVFDDENKEELVYALVADHVHKRIVVVFRGSVTMTDYLVDAYAVVTVVDNPLADQEGQPKKFKVHGGFYDYLFQKKQWKSSLISKVSGVSGTSKSAGASEASKSADASGATKSADATSGASSKNAGASGASKSADASGASTSADASGPSSKSADATSGPSKSVDASGASSKNADEEKGGSKKYDVICEKLNGLLQTYPDYDVYVTGHSLGGALCTIFSFYYTAENPDVRKPVKCYAFASPKFGTLSFRKAFQSLEQQEALFCLRVANEADPVTVLPRDPCTICPANLIFALLFLCCMQRQIYRHVGMGVMLYKSEDPVLVMKPYIHHAANESWYLRTWLSDWLKTLGRLVCLIVRFLACCLFCYHDENFRENHGYPTYLFRLQANESHLDQLTLEELYEDFRNKNTRRVHVWYW